MYPKLFKGAQHSLLQSFIFLCIFLSHVFPTNRMHFYEVLYISVKEEVSFSTIYRFFSWFLVYKSDDGPKHGPKLVIFVKTSVSCMTELLWINLLLRPLLQSN